MSTTPRQVHRSLAATFAFALIAVAGAAGYESGMTDRSRSDSAVFEQHRPHPDTASLALPRAEPIRDALERLSEHEMKAFYSGCSRQSMEYRLDGGEAMACSIGYDILLKRHFRGDFELLLAWSRTQAKAGRQ
ncbi:MAG: hypothetical protein IT531_08520 [Burkholderiales bacterium]|nr:hypothetical protein [Burkholderiales bacterium]